MYIQNKSKDASVVLGSLFYIYIERHFDNNGRINTRRSIVASLGLYCRSVLVFDQAKETVENKQRKMTSTISKGQ